MKRIITLAGIVLAVGISIVLVERTPWSEAAINTVVTDTGLISLSVDGLGTTNASGLIQVDKPAGGTVRSAHFACASVYAGGAVPDGTVSIDGTPINWSLTVINGPWHNHYADVTSVLQSGLDSAPTGINDLTIAEASSVVDGCVLGVVFNDPAITSARTAVLLFGGQTTTGDTFTISLADPIDTDDPGLVLNMGLGISFSAQDQSGPASHQCGVDANQGSTIDVNGTRLTSCAGNYDDADVATANGALLTVGGVGDSNNNPADANQLPGDGTLPRVEDDELYSLIPFVQDNDTSISVATLNPSNDDNIFFAHVLTLGTARVTTEICDDGLDNDGDGLVDLDDPDCQTATPTPTSTPDTATPVPETVVPTKTVLATRTVEVTKTALPTQTAVPTRTVQPTRTVAPPTVQPTGTVAPATTTPQPTECFTLSEKLYLLLGILQRWGAEEGGRRYRAVFDLNDDGIINHHDIHIVFDTPLCRRHQVVASQRGSA